MPASRSLAMCLHHSLAAERATRAGPRAFVLHTDLMADWRKQLARLESELAVPPLSRISGGGDRAADALGELVSPELVSARNNPSLPVGVQEPLCVPVRERIFTARIYVYVFIYTCLYTSILYYIYIYI
jgi:hypothetical protein